MSKPTASRPYFAPLLPAETWLVVRRGQERWEGSLHGPGLAKALEAEAGGLAELVETLARDYVERVEVMLAARNRIQAARDKAKGVR